MAARKAGRKHIVRNDHLGFHGWSVKVKRRGRDHVKYFPDAAHGGREASLRAALAHRDRMLRRLGPALYYSGKDVRNRTGVVGVHDDFTRIGRRIHRFYRASFPDGRGGTIRRSFSIAKYGRERALELAIQARRDGLAQLEALKRSELELELARRGADRPKRK